MTPPFLISRWLSYFFFILALMIILLSYLSLITIFIFAFKNFDLLYYIDIISYTLIYIWMQYLPWAHWDYWTIYCWNGEGLNEIDFLSLKYAEHISDWAMNSIRPSVLTDQILSTYFNPPVDVSPQGIMQRIQMFRLARYNITVNYNDYLNLGMFNFSMMFPWMFELRPYEYWVELTNLIYQNSSADLIPVEMSDFTGNNQGTRYVNRGLYNYLNSIIENHITLHRDLVNNNITCSQHHEFHQWLTSNRQYNLSNNYLLDRIEYYRSLKIFTQVAVNRNTPEDYMSDGNWIFQERD